MVNSYSGGGVIVGQNKKILVVSQHGNSWSLPKGMLEPGEDTMAATLREIEEETGITKLHLVKQLGEYRRFRIGIDGGEDRTHLKSITMFLFTTEELELHPQDPDNPEARWVNPQDVVDLLTHPADKAFFKQSLPEIQEFIA